MIVVDASVLAPALADTRPDGELARTRLLRERLAAPHLIDVEVASIFRRAVRGGSLEREPAQQALTKLERMPLQRTPHHPLLDRIWELRENLTAYDAAYIALAEAINALFITADTKIPKAPGLRCPVELIGPAATGAHG